MKRNHPWKKNIIHEKKFNNGKMRHKKITHGQLSE
jgi:hypothetical protein